MKNLKEHLTAQGVEFVLECEVTSFQKKGNHLIAVQTDRGQFPADEFVVATGAWSEQLLKTFDIVSKKTSN